MAVLCMLCKIQCTRCTLLMLLYLDCMCQCGLHVVLWSHIGTLLHCLAVEPRRTARFLFSSWCSSVILLNLYSMVWDSIEQSRANGFFIGLSCSPLFQTLSSIFLFLFFLSIGWYCGAGVFGLIGCKSLSRPCAADIFLIMTDFMASKF